MGKPIFFLHGWGGKKEGWEALIEKLQLTDRHFFALDLPGFGKSEEPTRAWTVRDYVDFFDAFVKEMYKKFGLEGNYDLVVHSFGGRMAIWKASHLDEAQAKELHAGGTQVNNSFAEKTSPHVDKMVFIAAAGIKPLRTLEMKAAGLVAKLGKGFLKIPVLGKGAALGRKLLYKALRAQDYEKTSGVMRETFVKVIGEDLKPYIAQIHHPTLLIWGENDSYVPLKDAFYMNKNVIGSQLRVISNGKHGIHKTHPAEVAAWIQEFLTL